ncbi:MAG: class F sortase [Chloroflexota bacterium]|nr:class F sortase [Chloroflexota bacterium]
MAAPGTRQRASRVLALVGFLVLVSPARGAAATSLEYVSTDGYVFVQSTTADGLRLGFLVDDADFVGMWSSYQRLGGRRILGPALGARYGCGPSVCQAFERAVLRWNPVLVEAEPVDVLAELGLDAEVLLQHVMHLPHPQAAGAGEELYDATEGLAATRDALGPARRLVVGLPVVVEQIGPQTALRGTRGVLLDPGQGGPVSILGGGQIALAAGLIPRAALVPQPVPPSAATEPARLVVQRLGLDTAIQSTAPAPDGSLPAPAEPETIAWYTDSARLGEGGTMLLAGHVDWVGRRAAFRDLDTLRQGDDVSVIDTDGAPLHYRVTETQWYPEDSPALHHLMVSPGWGPPTLTLVTCGGPFDLASRSYLDRLVVRAEPIDPGDERSE